jgi:putative spermidine/putrescine transport system permease protein
MKSGARRSIASIAKSRSELVVAAPVAVRGKTASEWKLALPLAAFMIAFFVAPLCVLIAMSLHGDGDRGSWSLLQYTKFLGDTFNLRVLAETIWLGAKATLVCLFFGYPLAWLAARASPRVRSMLLFLIVLPILTSVVVRTFSWIVILGKQGVLNKALLAVGLIDEPLKLLFSETGVVMVLAQVQLPLIVLPLLTTLSRIDPNLASASAALGAGEWRTFWKVTLPLSVPGMIAGCILAFAACVTAFVTQTLIGGARLLYMPLFIYQQAVGANNWPFAAAISVIFMVAVLLIVYALNVVAKTSRGQIYG